MSDLLADAAAALGAPPDIVMRSAEARAEADGVSVDDILSAWAGGETTGPPVSTAPPISEPEPAPESIDEEPESTPQISEVEPEPAPVEETPAPAAAPAAVATIARPMSVAEQPAPVLEGRRESHGSLLFGVLLLFLAGLLGSVVFPTIDADQGGGVQILRSVEADAGRNVYVREGCWYCHTQLVRPIVTDAGLGPVTQAGDLGSQLPVTVGVFRIGPDLAVAGSRAPADDAVLMRQFLLDPPGPDTLHQSYRYLSDADLDALVAYLGSLR